MRSSSSARGKGADALIPFWNRLKKSHARIETVCTDMSPAYTMSVRDHLPKALHVFDRLHLVKLFNDRLSDFGVVRPDARPQRTAWQQVRKVGS